MGEDEELLVADALQHDIRNLLRLEGGRGKKVEAVAPLCGKHVRLHSLGAEAGNPDALVAVRDRQPLEE